MKSSFCKDLGGCLGVEQGRRGPAKVYKTKFLHSLYTHPPKSAVIFFAFLYKKVLPVPAGWVVSYEVSVGLCSYVLLKDVIFPNLACFRMIFVLCLHIKMARISFKTIVRVQTSF